MSDATMSLAALQALPVFPLAARFPYISDAELLYLAQDIEVNGLAHPVVLFDGQLLDGRNRLMAITEHTDLTQVAVRYFDGTWADAVFHILSHNVHRRHLEPDFKAGLACDGDVIEACRIRTEEQRKAALASKTRDESGRFEPATQKIGEQAKAHDKEATAMAAQAVGGGTNREYVRQMAKLKTAAPILYEAVMAGKRKLSGRDGAWEQYQNSIKPGRGASDGSKPAKDKPYESYEKRVDRAVSAISEAIADLGILGRYDDLRYITEQLQGLIRQAERTFPTK